MSELVPPVVAGEPRTIVVPGDGSQALAFALPPGVTLDVESVVAEVDATGAGGPVTATLVVADQSGVVIARKRQSETIAAGAPGSATWALRLADSGGGAGAAGGFEYVRSTHPTTALASGVTAALEWRHFSGATLLDLTNVHLPTVIADGIYAFTVQVFLSAALYNLPGSMFAALAIDPGGAVIRSTGLALLNTQGNLGAGLGLAQPVVTLEITREMTAGMDLLLEVSQNNGNNRDFDQVGVVQKIS